MEGKNFESESLTFEYNETVKPGTHPIVINIHLDNPKLWWPWDMGYPNLYLAKTTIKADGVNHDFNETTFGIRRSYFSNHLLISDW